MAVYILSALLIIILAFAIYQLSKKSEIEEEIKKLKKRNQLSLMEELRAAEKVVWLCFTGGLLLTANYAITYFSGSELVNIPNWSFIQWSGALIGLVVAVSITFVQKVLYSSPTHSKAGLVVTTLVLTFVIISEIGSPIEKEGMKMKEASQHSAVFKAVVSGITGKTEAGTGYSEKIATATAEKAQHEFELERCERHQSKGEKRVKRCEDFENRAIAQAQAKIASYQSSASTTTRSNESSRLTLIQQAKALEHNTDNHSELVKLTASMLGASFLSSMMFLSLVLIVAFEAGFHFVGSRIGVLKTALGEMGNKEILRKQELSSLKKEKEFKDKSWSLKTDKSGVNKGYSPATGFNPTVNQAANDLGFKPIDVDQNKENIGIANAANDDDFKKETAKINTAPIVSTKSERVGVGAVGKSAEVIDKYKSDNRGASVSDTEARRSSADVFDLLYNHLKVQLKNEVIKPTTRAMSKTGHKFVKSLDGVDSKKLSLLDVASDVRIITTKLLKEKVLIERED
jgi:hypothetical protein